jgi:hypothetical protein
LQLQVCKFLSFKVKDEVRRKSFDVAIDLLIEALGSHPIHRSQIAIEQNAVAANTHDARNDIGWNEIGRRAHGGRSCGDRRRS